MLRCRSAKTGFLIQNPACTELGTTSKACPVSHKSHSNYHLFLLIIWLFWIAGVSSRDNHFSLSQSGCPLSSYQDQVAGSVYSPWLGPPWGDMWIAKLTQSFRSAWLFRLDFSPGGFIPTCITSLDSFDLSYSRRPLRGPSLYYFWSFCREASPHKFSALYPPYLSALYSAQCLW